MNGSPIDWSLYKTAYNKVRTTTLLYKSKDVIKCRDTDLLTVALKYIIDSPQQITGNLQNELVDDEDLVKIRQYHSTLFQFLEAFNPDILRIKYNSPRDSRVSIENTIAPPNTPRNSREELEEFKSIKVNPQAAQAAVNEPPIIHTGTYTAGIKANKNEFAKILSKIKILNEEILKTHNIITSIKDGLVDVKVDAYEDELQRLNKEKTNLVIELDKIKQTFNTFVDKSKQIKGGKSRKPKKIMITS